MRADAHQDIAPLFHAFIPSPLSWRIISYFAILTAGLIIALMLKITNDPMELSTRFPDLFLQAMISGGWIPVLVSCAFGGLIVFLCIVGRQGILKRVRGYTDFIAHTTPEQVVLTPYVEKDRIWNATCDTMCEPLSGKPWVLQVGKIDPVLAQRLHIAAGTPLPATLYRNDDLATPMIAIIDNAPLFLHRNQMADYHAWRHLDPPRRLSAFQVVMEWYLFILIAVIATLFLSMTIGCVIVAVQHQLKSTIDWLMFIGCLVFFGGCSAFLLKAAIIPMPPEIKAKLHLLRNGRVGIGVVEDIQLNHPATAFHASERTVRIRMASADTPQSVTTTITGIDTTYQVGGACALLYDPCDLQHLTPLTRIANDLNNCVTPVSWLEAGLFLFGWLFLFAMTSLIPLLWWMIATQPKT